VLRLGFGCGSTVASTVEVPENAGCGEQGGGGTAEANGMIKSMVVPSRGLRWQNYEIDFRSVDSRL